MAALTPDEALRYALRKRVPNAAMAGRDVEYTFCIDDIATTIAEHPDLALVNRADLMLVMVNTKARLPVAVRAAFDRLYEAIGGDDD